MLEDFAGHIVELSADRQIAGRRRIKLVLHEIFPTHDVWQDNGISWDEAYTAQNLDSVANMSLCVEFLTEERRLPYGHGMTEIRDNSLPLFEEATVVGHFEKAYITDIELGGVNKRVLMADGYIDEMRYPKFVEWLQEKMIQGSVSGSVEIVGRPENNNRIIYDGGWKEKGRVPQTYDYTGHCILGIKPADDAAVVIELNNNKSIYNKEDENMDEKTMGQFVELVKTSVNQTITELNNKSSEYENTISELNNQLAAKDTEIGELNQKISTAEADIAAKDATIAEQTTELNTLKEANAALEKEKKLAELNSALAGFSAEEQAFAQSEIDAFKADPCSVEINSITNKICVEIVHNAKAHISEQNSALDIFGGIDNPDESDGDINVF